MISIVYTRPEMWDRLESTLDLTYVPLGGPVPRRNSGRLAGDGIGVVALPKMVDLLEQTLKEKKPDIFLRPVHQRFGLAEMERCRKASPDTLWVLHESNKPWRVSDFVERYRQFVDAVLITSWSDETINAYLDIGIPVVPGFWDGFDPSDHVPLPIEEASKDCFFGGSNLKKGSEWVYPNGEGRHEFINRVADEFDLELRGQTAEWGARALKALTHRAYYQAMQRARIVLGYNHLDLERYYTRRVIHSGASGRLFVTRYIPGMEKDFDDWLGPVWFKTDNGGIDLIKYYLDRSEERGQLAESQYKWFMKHHTWEARLRQFEKVASKLLERKVEVVS